MDKGLGDTLERIFEVTGVKGIVKRFTKATGVDCGCDKRKELFNQLFPYGKPDCMNRGQYESWTIFLEEQQGSTLNVSQQELVAKLHSDLFNHKFHKPCSCRPRQWRRWIEEINTIYATYQTTRRTTKSQSE